MCDFYLIYLIYYNQICMNSNMNSILLYLFLVIVCIESVIMN